MSRIEDLTKLGDSLDWSSFVEIRNLICFRLTLFNARRGADVRDLLMPRTTYKGLT